MNFNDTRWIIATIVCQCHTPLTARRGELLGYSFSKIFAFNMLVFVEDVFSLYSLIQAGVDVVEQVWLAKQLC